MIRWEHPFVITAVREKREYLIKGYILACKVFCEISFVKAPMPLFEMAAREKRYSVLGRRPSTTNDLVGPNVFFNC